MLHTAFSFGSVRKIRSCHCLFKCLVEDVMYPVWLFFFPQPMISNISHLECNIVIVSYWNRLRHDHCSSQLTTFEWKFLIIFIFTYLWCKHSSGYVCRNVSCLLLEVHGLTLVKWWIMKNILKSMIFSWWIIYKYIQLRFPNSQLKRGNTGYINLVWLIHCSEAFINNYGVKSL
jgi:hypothetical protein